MDERNCGFCTPCAEGHYDDCEHIGKDYVLEIAKLREQLAAAKHNLLAMDSKLLTAEHWHKRATAQDL